MKIAKLFFPGQFEDAYLYAGCLLILTEERGLLVYNLRKLTRRLEKAYPDLAPVLSLMFAHNDWLSSDLFRSSLQNRAIWQSISKALEKLAWPLEVASYEELDTAVQQIRIKDTAILDILIYNRRLYMGASAGFYHLDLEWDKGIVEIEGSPTKRLDARCVNMLAGYGAVNASCGKEGLFAALDEFDWLSRRKTRYPEMTRLTQQSLRASWINYDLVNYSSSDEPFILRSEYEELKSSQGREGERKVLTTIGEQTVDIKALFEQLQEKYSFDHDAIQYTYNTNKLMFVYTFGGGFYSARIDLDDYRNPKYRFKKAYKGEDTRILSAHPVNPGVVIETDDRVLLFAKERWHTIHDAPVMSIRTFPKSEPYSHIIAITTEEGVTLASIYDDPLGRESEEPPPF